MERSVPAEETAEQTMERIFVELAEKKGRKEATATEIRRLTGLSIERTKEILRRCVAAGKIGSRYVDELEKFFWRDCPPAAEVSSPVAPTNLEELHEERVVLILRARIRRFKEQPRIFFDPQELAELAGSIAEVGQRRPILVRRISGDQEHDYELIDGERRWLACGMAGVKTMLALVRKPGNVEDQFLESVVANFGSAAHTPLEIAKAIERLRVSARMRRYSASEQIERIAKIFARSVPWVYQHLALLRLDPKVQSMVGPDVPKDKRLDFSVAYYLTSLHADIQLEIAREVVEKGLKLKEARFLARKIAEREGMQAGRGRKRNPSDEYIIFSRFVTGICREAGMFQEEVLRNRLLLAFKNQNPKQREALIRDLGQGIAALKKLQNILAGRPR